MMYPKYTPGRRSSAHASSAPRTRASSPGCGAFTDDREVERALHVAFRRSDQSHARIAAIDCAAARTAPGVAAVFSADDLNDLVKPVVATSRMPGYYATPILPLARGKVRYVGEPVVGVIADTRYHAEDALELVTIDYEPLPVIIDPEAAVKPDAPLLHEEAGTNVLVSREFKRGDVDAAFQSAAVRVGRPLPHAPQDRSRDGTARIPC